MIWRSENSWPIGARTATPLSSSPLPAAIPAVVIYIKARHTYRIIRKDEAHVIRYVI
jgi:hypothetical protein